VNQYRNLDILRAIAVLIVLGAHLSPYSILQQAIGHFAVLIFFVHTALVLLFSLERLSLTNGWVPRFYVQRAFRIYPLSVACVLLSLAFRIAWPALIFEPRSTLSVGANLLLVQNLLHEQSSISAPLWSLPFEIQMYAVLPVVFWTIRKYHKQGALLVLATGFVVAIGEKLLHDDVWLAQFVPCFLAGALAYAWQGANRRIPWWAWPCFIVVWGLLYGLYGFAIRAEMGGWLASLVLGMLIPLVQDAPANWLSKAAALVARYSYGIYLSHVPLIWLCFRKLTGVSTPLRWTLFFLLQCLVPVSVYHAFENPMIQVGKAVAARIGRKQHSPAMAARGSR